MTSDNLFLRMREELFSNLASTTENVILLSPFLSVPIALQLTKVARTSPVCQQAVDTDSCREALTEARKS